MDQQVLHFLYFVVIVGSGTLIIKYITTAQAAKYKMEQEKYKYERQQDYYNSYH